MAALELFVSILAARPRAGAQGTGDGRRLPRGRHSAPASLPALDRGEFMAAFRDKGHSSLLGAIPVHVITRPDVALTGAARVGLDL